MRIRQRHQFQRLALWISANGCCPSRNSHCGGGLRRREIRARHHQAAVGLRQRKQIALSGGLREQRRLGQQRLLRQRRLGLAVRGRRQAIKLPRALRVNAVTDALLHVHAQRQRRGRRRDRQRLHLAERGRFEQRQHRKQQINEDQHQRHQHHQPAGGHCRLHAAVDAPAHAISGMLIGRRLCHVSRCR